MGLISFIKKDDYYITDIIFNVSFIILSIKLINYFDESKVLKILYICNIIIFSITLLEDIYEIYKKYK